MASLEDAVDAIADRTGFSGVVRVDRSGGVELAKAYGLADRERGVPNTVETSFATASGTKTLTALTVMSLIQDGTLELETTARSVLGDDLPLIDDRVTVEHLLAHRSGIGDYLDEDAIEDINDFVLPVPFQELATTEAFVAILDGYPQVFEPGERFAYNNGGYVVLALIAERVSGQPFHDLVLRRVCEPAGMPHTAFLRTDELPGRCRARLPATATAAGRTRCSSRSAGTGTAASTRPPPTWPRSGTRCSPAGSCRAPRSTRCSARAAPSPTESKRYGLGFHVDATRDDVTWLEGYDAGASMFSTHVASADLTATVIANWTDGAWPIQELLDERLGT